MLFSPGVSLILGGARSGKSSFAEKLAGESGRAKVYLATSQLWDSEMEERVSIHKSRRGPEWQLVEEPIELLQQIEPLATRNRVVLVDCLTLWLTNLMMADQDVTEVCGDLVRGLAKLQADCSVLLVSNEVGQGIVPVEKMARDFRDHAGRLHQDIAANAHNVWFVTAGLPQKLK